MLAITLSKSHFEKLAEYLFDLSKLLMGSTFVSVFVPGSTGGAFNVWLFAIGVLLAIVCILIGLKILPSSTV